MAQSRETLRSGAFYDIVEKSLGGKLKIQIKV